ncbi:TPA: minor capsid protein [Streptococcus suis]|nr:minor capsid protein [Streptococcus suis]HEM4055890.1 minor capsid protein [Streptococcus suis]
MTKNHNDYWQKRVDDIFKHQDMTDEVFFKKLSQIYSESSVSLQKDLFEFYGKYAEDSKISLSDARERLSRIDLSDYRANVEKYRKQAEKDPELLRRINEQYMSSRATRMDVLNMEVIYKMGVLQGILEKSFEGYLRSSAEYAYRKAMGGRSGNINEPALKEIVKTPFNGYNYSQQLWGHVDNLAKDLKDTLKRGFVRGEHPKVLARDLSARYKVANHRAETLIRTDGTSVINRATARRYIDAGLEFYRILVHMDNRTTEICRKHHAEDKRYRLDEMKVGVNAPPFHFNCRSGIVPDEEEINASSLIDLSRDTENIELYRMYRNKDANKRRTVNITRQNKLTKDFRKRGGVIWQDDESELYLKSRKASAMNLNADTIVLQKKATISEILEELFHAEQWRDGRLVDTPISKIKAEIEAQNYLLSVEKRYNIPRVEVEQTKRNLQYWREELKKYEN